MVINRAARALGKAITATLAQSWRNPSNIKVRPENKYTNITLS
jgi:hypothetical protein